MTTHIKPKVLILISSTRIGGPGKGIIQFLSQCGDDDLDYVLCTFTHNGQREYSFTKGIKEAGLHVHVIESSGINCYKEIRALIKKKDIDIMQTHEYKSHFFGLLIKMSTQVAWITWAHGWTNENIKIRMYNIFEKFCHTLSCMAITVSPKLFKTVRSLRLGNKPTHLVLNGIEQHTIKTQRNFEYPCKLQHYANDGIFKIGIFGRFSPEKGQDIAIHAFAQVIQKHTNLALLLIGEGQEEAHLRDLVSHYQLESAVYFLGYKDNIGDFFNLVDLTLLPSRSEGLPNVALESMILETPVLSTIVGGVSEIISHQKNGWLCTSENITDMSNKLEHILENSEEYATVRKICKQSLFPKFDPVDRKHTIIEKYISLIQ